MFKAGHGRKHEHLLIPGFQPEFTGYTLKPIMNADNISIARRIHISRPFQNISNNIKSFGTVLGPVRAAATQSHISQRVYIRDIPLNQIHLSVSGQFNDATIIKFTIISQRIQSRARNILKSHNHAHILRSGSFVFDTILYQPISFVHTKRNICPQATKRLYAKFHKRPGNTVFFKLRINRSRIIYSTECHSRRNLEHSLLASLATLVVNGSIDFFTAPLFTLETVLIFNIFVSNRQRQVLDIRTSLNTRPVMSRNPAGRFGIKPDIFLARQNRSIHQ